MNPSHNKRGSHGVMAALGVALGAVFCAGCAGCADSKKPMPVPPMPPRPTTANCASAIAAAGADTRAAQSNVRAGTAHVKADRGLEAVPLLAKADGQLSDALQDLAEANAHVVELEQKIIADRSAHEAQVSAYRSQIAARDAQASAYQSQIAARDAANKKLATENDHLKNEVLRQAKLRIGALGSLLLVVSVGLVAAAIWAGFPLGFKLAPICGCMGAAALALAVMLSKIVLGAEIMLGLAALGALGYGAWQLLHHTPPAVAAQLAALKREKQLLLARLSAKPGAPAGK